MISSEKDNYYKKLLKNRLSEKRYYHSLCVAKEAIKFAQENGADIDKCYIAGLLHDICKETDDEKNRQTVLNSTLNVCDIEKQTKPLWHAIAGAEYVKNQLGIIDSEIIGAIRYHTVGKKEMTMVEKIIMMADYVSVDRDYGGVCKLRELAHTDFKQAMSEAVGYSLKDLIDKKSLIPVSTVECYNDLTK